MTENDEAPKEQEDLTPADWFDIQMDEMQRTLAVAVSRAEEAERAVHISAVLHLTEVRGLERDLAAAKDKITELEREKQEALDAWGQAALMTERERLAVTLGKAHRLLGAWLSGETPRQATSLFLQYNPANASSALDAANARADAAERKERAQKHFKEIWRDKAKERGAERDQLAVRVTELECGLQAARIVRDAACELRGDQCTPEEREVLEAMADYTIVILEDWKRDGTPRRKRLAAAELANRAAKAKREDK